MLPGNYSLATPAPHIQEWQRCPWGAVPIPFEQSMRNVLLPTTFAQCLRAPYILCIAPKQKTQHGLPSFHRKARNPTSTLQNTVQGLACRALLSRAQTLLRPSMGAGVLTNRGHMTPFKGTRTVLVYKNPKCGYKGSRQTLG